MENHGTPCIAGVLLGGGPTLQGKGVQRREPPAHHCLCAYLHSGLWEVDLQGHLLSHEDVRVAGLGKKSF